MLSAIFLILLFTAWVLVQIPSVQSYIIQKISDSTELEISAGEINLYIWDEVGITIHDFQAESKQGDKKVNASKAHVILDGKRFIKGDIVPVSIYLSQPQIEIKEYKDDTVSPKDEVKKPQSLWIPNIPNITIEQGQLHIHAQSLRLTNFNLDIHQMNDSPSMFNLNGTGRLNIKEETVKFSLKGILNTRNHGKGLPEININLKTANTSMNLIPWPEFFPVHHGNIKTDLHISGVPGESLAINGQATVDTFLLRLQRHDRLMDYSFPKVTIDFQSVITGKKINAPSMQISTDRASLALTLDLDLTEPGNPYLDLELTSPFMPIQNFKGLLPHPILSLWLEDQLLPVLCSGNVRTEIFALRGNFKQFKKMYLPENHSTMELRLECKDFTICDDNLEIPFEEVSADVILAHGDLSIPNLKACFGSSLINHVDLSIKDTYNSSRFVDVFVDGSFDIHELIGQKTIRFLPDNVRQRLDKIGEITGELDCLARIGYTPGWAFPRITEAEFSIRNCRINQDELLQTLILKKGAIHIDEKNQNRLTAVGAWGNTTFELSSDFGQVQADMNLEVRKVYVASATDVNEFLSLFYPQVQQTVMFNRHVPVRVTATKEDEHWEYKGDIDLRNVSFSTGEFNMDPPGSRSSILFELYHVPDKLIALESILCELDNSSIELSALYDIEKSNLTQLNLLTSGLSVKDLGIRSNRSEIPIMGDVKANIEIRNFSNDLNESSFSGNIYGSNLAFEVERFESPVNNCDFSLTLSGDRLKVDMFEMNVGNSPITVTGDLTGWKSLSGDLLLKSSFIDTADIFAATPGTMANETGQKKPLETGQKKTDSPKTGFADSLDIHVDLDVSKGRFRDLDLGRIQADVDIKGKDFFINKSRIDLEHGAVTTEGYIKRAAEPEQYFTGHVELREQPVNELMEGLRIGRGRFKGKLKATADFQMQGKKREDLLPSMRGTVDATIKEGIVKESYTLAKVLERLSLEKIYKKKPEELRDEKGIYFERIKGSGTIEQGILSTEDFIMQSPTFNAFAKGDLNLATRTMDVFFVTQPFEFLDYFLRHIPIIGYIIAGDDRSIIAFPYEIKGHISKPEIELKEWENVPAGISGIVTRMIQTPGRLFDQTKEFIMRNGTKSSENKGKGYSSESGTTSEPEKSPD